MPHPRNLLTIFWQVPYIFWPSHSLGTKTTELHVVSFRQLSTGAEDALSSHLRKIGNHLAQNGSLKNLLTHDQNGLHTRANSDQNRLRIAARPAVRRSPLGQRGIVPSCPMGGLFAIPPTVPWVHHGRRRVSKRVVRWAGLASVKLRKAPLPVQWVKACHWHDIVGARPSGGI